MAFYKQNVNTTSEAIVFLAQKLEENGYDIISRSNVEVYARVPSGSFVVHFKTRGSATTGLSSPLLEIGKNYSGGVWTDKNPNPIGQEGNSNGQSNAIVYICLKNDCCVVHFFFPNSTGLGFNVGYGTFTGLNSNLPSGFWASGRTRSSGNFELTFLAMSKLTSSQGYYYNAISQFYIGDWSGNEGDKWMYAVTPGRSSHFACSCPFYQKHSSYRVTPPYDSVKKYLVFNASLTTVALPMTLHMSVSRSVADQDKLFPAFNLDHLLFANVEVMGVGVEVTYNGKNYVSLSSDGNDLTRGMLVEV